VLVMPDVRCVSDEQAELVRERVKKGMGLVATGQTAMFTPWVRERNQSALADVFGLQSAAEARWGTGRRTQYGKGRVVYFPSLPPSRPLRKPEEFAYVDVHQLPANWREFIEAVRWAGNPSLELLAPQTVAAEFLTQENRVLVHLVNFDSEHPVSGIELRLGGALSRGKRRAHFLSPESDGPRKLDLSGPASARTITAPLLEVYGIIVVE
jgi:hypothetical protein